eukprot:scaffold93303_cov64-Phaeocystis_antarctica.AAC.1
MSRKRTSISATHTTSPLPFCATSAAARLNYNTAWLPSATHRPHGQTPQQTAARDDTRQQPNSYMAPSRRHRRARRDRAKEGPPRTPGVASKDLKRVHQPREGETGQPMGMRVRGSRK